MDIAEMHKEFELRLDKVQSNALAEFTIDEIDSMLNTATLMYVKQRYGGYTNYLTLGFEEIQKRTDDLKTLVLTAEVITQAVSYEDDFVAIDLSNINNYLFYLRGRIQVKKPNCSARWSSIRLVQQDDLEAIKTDPFNNPTFVHPVGYFENNSLLVSVGEDTSLTTVTSGKVTYLKYPDQLAFDTNNSSDLPKHTHDEIVELAVKLALNSIESPREQTQQGILNIKE